MNLTDDIFDATLPETVCLVDFYADWCGPCRAVSPIMDKLEASGIPVFKVNVDDSPNLAKKFGVRSIPTVVVMANKEPVSSLVGTRTFEEYQSAASEASNVPSELE